MDIREAQKTDLRALLELYTHLHANQMPEDSDMPAELFESIICDKNHHILVGTQDENIISSCVAVIIPNLTRGQRPYCIIENVITHPDFRGRGCASALLARARELAQAENCYKIMLMTGSKTQSTLDFYERAGYNKNDKIAFIMWL